MWRRFDSLLRAEGRYSVGEVRVPWSSLAAITIGATMAYGAVMGAYSLRPLQMLYSALKVPLLLAVATVATLPSFYVILAVMGLRDDLRPAVRAIASAQATMAIALASLSPVVAVLYLVTENYTRATLINGGLFAIAAVVSQSMVRRHYAPLVARDPRHRAARRAWGLVYAFVAIQSAWVLRPFIGDPEQATEFFRKDAWTNAYVEIGERAMREIFGSRRS